jgi:hypothetical protein
MSDFFRALCPSFACFHTLSGFERTFFIFLFCSIPPPDLPECIDKAPHPMQAGVLQGQWIVACRIFAASSNQLSTLSHEFSPSCNRQSSIGNSVS